MNVEIGTEGARFPEKEYINVIFLAVQYIAQTICISKQNMRMCNSIIDGTTFFYIDFPTVLLFELTGAISYIAIVYDLLSPFHLQCHPSRQKCIHFICRQGGLVVAQDLSPYL